MDLQGEVAIGGDVVGGNYSVYHGVARRVDSTKGLVLVAAFALVVAVVLDTFWGE